MPEPAGTFNDGGIKFVRQRISAKDGNGTVTSYIVKSGSIKAPDKRIVSENENGVEFQQALMAGIRTGSVDLQFLAPADNPPARFQVISLLTSFGTALNVITGEVDDDFGANKPATVKMNVYEEQASQVGPAPG